MTSEISAYEEIINNIKKDDSILNISSELKLKSKNSIKLSNEKLLCNAAVKYPTMKAAYNDIKLGKKVILLKPNRRVAILNIYLMDSVIKQFRIHVKIVIYTNRC